jgi:hypothetical protein
VRVHSISFSTKKILSNSHFPVSSPYSTVPHPPTNANAVGNNMTLERPYA